MPDEAKTNTTDDIQVAEDPDQTTPSETLNKDEMAKQGEGLVIEETNQERPKRVGKRKGPHEHRYIQNLDHRRTKYNRTCRALMSKVNIFCHQHKQI